MPLLVKECESCRQPFEKAANVSLRSWEGRRFCSHKCHAMSQKVLRTKMCVKCGKGFSPVNSKVKYCSQECAKVRFKDRRGSNHQSWKGGRTVHGPSGYVLRRMDRDHPFADKMLKKHGYVMEHRLVMAEALGRPLEDWETVHHINGDTGNNDLSNLELRTGQHGRGATRHCLTCTCTD